MSSDHETITRVNAPLSTGQAQALRAGDRVLISGIVYTARDAAHKRMATLLEAGESLPFPLQDQVIYYVGPAPAAPGEIIGPAGPTTACRLDAYTPLLLAHGLRGMIGKGKRSPDVREAIAHHGAVYFAVTGGAAVLVARRIRKVEVVAWEDLGTEAVRRLEVADLPAIVVNDSQGNDLYEDAVAQFQRGSYRENHRS